MSDSDLTLLPSNSTPLEIAVDQTSNRLLEIDPSIIKRVKDPATTPSAFLPFLAWERGVDLWYDDWPEWKKRRITGESYRLKMLKGTLPGVNGYLFYVDAVIQEHVLPPQGMVARAQDPERQAAFKERFAELRVYPFADRGARTGVIAKTTGSPTALVGRAVARGRPVPYGRKAVIWDKGVETDIRSQDQLRIDSDETSIQATTFAVPGKARGTEHIAGRAAVGSAVAHSTARGRMFVLGADTINPSGAAIPPGGSSVAVLNVEPEKVFERHEAFAGAPVAGRKPRLGTGRMVARSEVAGLHIFDRWYLFDESRASFDPYRAVGPVVGKSTVSLSPFRAHLRVNARFSRAGRAATVGKISVGRAVAGRASDKIERVGRAIYRAKALRDDIRFTTRTFRPMELKDLSFDGEHPFGGMVPIQRFNA